jgi:exonuclease SbcD
MTLRTGCDTAGAVTGTFYGGAMHEILIPDPMPAPDRPASTVARLVVVADVHVDHGRWGTTNPTTGRNRAWESAHRTFRAAGQVAIDTAADGFVVAGDLFLNGRPTAEAAEMAAEVLRTVAAAGIPVTLILGNHELRGIPAGLRHPLLRFVDIDGVAVVDEPAVVHTRDGVGFLAVPWPKRAELLAALDATGLAPAEADATIAAHVCDLIEDFADGFDTPTVLIGHLAVAEASFGGGSKGSEVLLAPVASEPVIPVAALEVDNISAVVLGHIHNRQAVGTRTHYVGSPDRVDFAEEHDPKGVTVIDIDADGSCTVAFVETPARRLRTVNVDAPDLDGLDAEWLVRVRLSIDQNRLDPDLRTKIVETGARIATVMPAPRQSTQRTSNRPHLAEATDPTEGFVEWAAHQGIVEADVTRMCGLVDKLRHQQTV